MVIGPRDVVFDYKWCFQCPHCYLSGLPHWGNFDPYVFDVETPAGSEDDIPIRVETTLDELLKTIQPECQDGSIPSGIAWSVLVAEIEHTCQGCGSVSEVVLSAVLTLDIGAFGVELNDNDLVEISLKTKPPKGWKPAQEVTDAYRKWLTEGFSFWDESVDGKWVVKKKDRGRLAWMKEIHKDVDGK